MCKTSGWVSFKNARTSPIHKHDRFQCVSGHAIFRENYPKPMLIASSDHDKLCPRFTRCAWRNKKILFTNFFDNWLDCNCAVGCWKWPTSLGPLTIFFNSGTRQATCSVTLLAVCWLAIVQFLPADILRHESWRACCTTSFVGWSSFDFWNFQQLKTSFHLGDCTLRSRWCVSSHNKWQGHE